jgi:NhaP-type Na+/H+ or K+/H+ antiporter
MFKSNHLLAASHENGNLDFFVLFLVMMLFFFICAAVIEKYKPQYGHETCYTILFGVSLSLILYVSIGTEAASSFKFNSNFFFNFFLPPIIFNSGFTMYKKTFFKNLGNVAVFGLMVTLVCFVIYSFFGWLLLQKVGIEMSNPSCLNKDIPCLVNGLPVQNPQVINMPTMQILLFTALLCSSDVVAAVSIVDYTQQPKLYSCIFGEGVFNDIVSIILFNTVIQLQSTEFTAATPFEIIGEFFMLGIVSLSIGLLFGLLTSFIFKHCRFLRVNPIIETFLLFAFSMVSYFVSDLTVIANIEMSGIISLLTCGIV